MMNKEDYLALKEKFLNIYSSVPLPLRDQIIAVGGKNNDEELSWRACKVEIENDGPSAESILQQLMKIGVLKNG